MLQSDRDAQSAPEIRMDRAHAQRRLIQQVEEILRLGKTDADSSHVRPHGVPYLGIGEFRDDYLG
jgi:hypothetical protein